VPVVVPLAVLGLQAQAQAQLRAWVWQLRSL
jgi:hypothetical protein